jgi:hypothetical protein
MENEWNYFEEEKLMLRKQTTAILARRRSTHVAAMNKAKLEREREQYPNVDYVNAEN